MLVQQPPILTLAYLKRNITPSDTVILHRRENRPRAFGGLRMNMPYDLVQSVHIALQYFCFRVSWSWYETYPFREQSLRSDPDPTSIEDSSGAKPLKNALESADVISSYVVCRSFAVRALVRVGERHVDMGSGGGASGSDGGSKSSSGPSYARAEGRQDLVFVRPTRGRPIPMHW